MQLAQCHIECEWQTCDVTKVNSGQWQQRSVCHAVTYGGEQ